MEVTPPIFDWIKRNWYWLTPLAVVVSAAIGSWIKARILTPIKFVRARLNKIEKVIPQEALDKGFILSTCRDCAMFRKECTNHVISQELLDVMSVIKQAMVLVISHNKDIPQEKKDDVLKALVK